MHKTLRWQKIEAFLQTHEYIMNADMRELCGASAATANRIFAGLVTNGTLIRYQRVVTGYIQWNYKII